jgi:hypothetical protein
LIGIWGCGVRKRTKNNKEENIFRVEIVLLIDDDDHRRRRVVLHSLISMWAHGIACSKRVPLTHFTLSFYFFSYQK